MKIESLRLEFNSDVEQKSHMEIEFVRLEFHREERKNDEGEETQQNKEKEIHEYETNSPSPAIPSWRRSSI